MTRSPGVPDLHVKLRPASMRVTVQRAGSSFGCLIRARLPTANGPVSSLLSVVTDRVQSGQCSTSVMTFQMVSGGASTWMDFVKLRMFGGPQAEHVVAGFSPRSGFG